MSGVFLVPDDEHLPMIGPFHSEGTAVAFLHTNRRHMQDWHWIVREAEDANSWLTDLLIEEDA